ncbi:MAG: hypothetical protein ACXACX_22400 [Candidatus Hodarchaeales archaeon]|jgi:hypothetical protein
MIKDENTEVKLFGFRINNTIAIILVFLTIPMIIGTLYPFIMVIYSFIQQIGLIFGGPISYTINLLINILIIIFNVTIFTYIIIVCSKTKKLQREIEYSQKSWFGFNLTKTSLRTIGILSILGIITGSISIINQISNLVYIISVTYSFHITFLIPYVPNIIVNLAMMLFYIYTIIVCREVNSVLANSNSVSKEIKFNK